MGKGATLTGRVGDILLCNIVADERTATTYLLHNCFNAEDVERYLVYGTALDNQRAASVRGTFLQNWGYLDALHRAGNNLVEMEAGPYLEAFTELVLPAARAARRDGQPGRRADRPGLRALRVGHAVYQGPDAGRAQPELLRHGLHVRRRAGDLRRILNCEVARLSATDGPRSVQTTHATQPVTVQTAALTTH